jgi:uncharacterized protein (TIGR02186 family)
MKMFRALFLLFCLTAPVAAQETVVTGLSTDNIALTANFSGSELFVFGAIRRDGPTPEGASPLDIIITIKGPEKPVTVRRKSRRFGIWINTESVRVRQAPSFYAIATTRPLVGLLSETERLRYQIGMDQAVRRVSGHATLTDTSDFAEALVRLRESQDLYDVLEGDVSVAEQTLFQTRIQMPANIVEGDYVAQFFLVRDQEVISEGSTIINVEKAGIERWVYNLSRQQPLVYGILSVLVALIAGWLAATVFRLVRR